jgi:hypothetical protein
MDGQSRDTLKQLANCWVPKCAACYYGKASRRLWRERESQTKTSLQRPQFHAKLCQLTKFSWQSLGWWVMSKAYPQDNGFVDQFSELSFVHLRKICSGEETLDVKMAFWRLCSLTERSNTALSRWKWALLRKPVDEQYKERRRDISAFAGSTHISRMEWLNNR